MPAAKKKHAKLSLDYEGHYPFSLEEKAGDNYLKIALDYTTDGSQLIGRLHDRLKLKAGDAIIAPNDTRDHAKNRKAILFKLPNPLPAEFTLVMPSRHGEQALSHLMVNQAGEMPHLEPAADHAVLQLALSETRELAMSLYGDAANEVPHNRAKRMGFVPAQHAPITDLHTHASAQIRAEDLFEIAYDADLDAKRRIEAGEKGVRRICYPLGLLGSEFLNVAPNPDLPGEMHQQPMSMPIFKFDPAKDEKNPWEYIDEKTTRDENNIPICDGIPVSDLSERQKQAIIRKMGFAPDQTIDFNSMDPQMYRYRNPFAKHPALTKKIIHKIAEDCAEKGVVYSELSTAAMLDPAWLKAAIEALDEIERDGVGPNHTKVTLRLQINLSRYSTPQQCMTWLEKTKYLLHHPYIVGPDLTGYEATKTSDFHWVFTNMMQYCREEGIEPYIIHRLHAGEMDKNLTNVGDVVDMMHQFFDQKKLEGPRVRIGHAYNYEMTREQLRMIREMAECIGHDLIATERCIDANQVYRSCPRVHQQPGFIPAPVFFGSDGAGAVLTSPVGLAYSTLASEKIGWTLDNLTANQQFEREYIARQHAREQEKCRHFEKRFGTKAEGEAAFLEGYENLLTEMKSRDANSYLPPEFAGKKSLTCVGPSGSSWNRMTPRDQDTCIRAAEFIARVFDPQKTFCTLGRVQRDGYSRAQDRAFMKQRLANPSEKMLVLGRYNGADSTITGELPQTLSYLQPIPGGMDAVPSNMVKFTHAHGGKVFIFAGSDFSSAMAGISQDKGVSYAIQIPQKGLFNERQHTCNTNARFDNFDMFVETVFKQYGPNHFFKSKEEMEYYLKPGIDIDKVAEEVSALVLHRHLKRIRFPEDRGYESHQNGRN